MIVKDDMELGAHKASRCAINKRNGGCMVGRSSEIYTDAGSGFPFRNFMILTKVWFKNVNWATKRMKMM